jgi:hypothetical protein
LKLKNFKGRNKLNMSKFEGLNDHEKDPLRMQKMTDPYMFRVFRETCQKKSTFKNATDFFQPLHVEVEV